MPSWKLWIKKKWLQYGKGDNNMKRTIKEADGKHIIIYQDNGFEQHIKMYDDGTREEWLEFKK